MRECLEGVVAPHAHRGRTLAATVWSPTGAPSQDAPPQTAHRTPENPRCRHKTCLLGCFFMVANPSQRPVDGRGPTHTQSLHCSGTLARAPSLYCVSPSTEKPAPGAAVARGEHFTVKTRPCSTGATGMWSPAHTHTHTPLFFPCPPEQFKVPKVPPKELWLPHAHTSGSQHKSAEKKKKEMGSSVPYKTRGTVPSQKMGHGDASGQATDGCTTVPLQPSLSRIRWTPNRPSALRSLRQQQMPPHRCAAPGALQPPPPPVSCGPALSCLTPSGHYEARQGNWTPAEAVLDPEGHKGKSPSNTPGPPQRAGRQVTAFRRRPGSIGSAPAVVGAPAPATGSLKPPLQKKKERKKNGQPGIPGNCLFKERGGLNTVPVQNKDVAEGEEASQFVIHHAPGTGGGGGGEWRRGKLGRHPQNFGEQWYLPHLRQRSGPGYTNNFIEKSSAPIKIWKPKFYHNTFPCPPPPPKEILAHNVGDFAPPRTTHALHGTRRRRHMHDLLKVRLEDVAHPAPHRVEGDKDVLVRGQLRSSSRHVPFCSVEVHQSCLQWPYQAANQQQHHKRGHRLKTTKMSVQITSSIGMCRLNNTDVCTISPARVTLTSQNLTETTPTAALTRGGGLTCKGPSRTWLQKLQKQHLLWRWQSAK